MGAGRGKGEFGPQSPEFATLGDGEQKVAHPAREPAARRRHRPRLPQQIFPALSSQGKLGSAPGLGGALPTGLLDHLLHPHHHHFCFLCCCPPPELCFIPVLSSPPCAPPPSLFSHTPILIPDLQAPQLSPLYPNALRSVPYTKPPSSH